jgi:D-aminoacyl-tRNA deacylase
LLEGLLKSYFIQLRGGKEFWRLPPIGFYSNENSRIDVIGIVVSRSDSVSVLIGKEILKIGRWVQKNDSNRTDAEGGGKYYCADGFELREFEGLHIQLLQVELAFKEPECIIFVSRHVGETGALLTAHYTGNFGEAKFGGRPRELSRSCPNLHKAIVDSLRKYAPSNYEVGIECTHHGPSDVNVPSMFVEIGSS